MALGSDYDYWIAYSFECMPPDVRAILKLFADTYNPVSGFVIAGVVDLMWETANIENWEVWKEAYHNWLNISEITVVIGDNDVRVYQSNRLWMNMLKLELLSGRVSVEMPFPCRRLQGYGIPVPIGE